MSARIRIVDDHELLAFSLACALQAEGFDAAALQPSTLEEVLDAVLADSPDLVLLDLQLGGSIGSGLSLVRPLTEAGVSVLTVSGVTDRVTIAETVELGAVGYVGKGEPFEVLLETAARAAAGESVMSATERTELLAELRRHRAQQRAAQAPFEQLTTKERHVLGALCAGGSVTSVAKESYVSVPTVRTQVRAILLKLQVGSQREAVALALRCGWYADRLAARPA